MASISSLTGSGSASSIYGNRNVISGLASGMDTESMIENAVSGIKKKIQGIQQKQTKVQWKQDAYRSILDKMIALNRKYTSYTSNTNLFSQSFFNKAVKTTTAGKYADAVTATGRTSSDVRINSIDKLATSASYKTSVATNDIFSQLGLTANSDGVITAGGELNLTDDVEVGALSGAMTLTYGGNSVYLSFNEKDVYDSVEDLAAGIRDKLSDAMVRTGSGDYVKASDRIDVKVEGDKITFADKTTGGNAVYVNSIDKALQRKLNMADAGKDTNSFVISNKNSLIDKKDPATYLSNKTLNVTFNGKSGTIDLGNLKKDVDDAWQAAITDWEKNNTGSTITDDKKKELRGEALQKKLKERIQEGLDDQFGKGKITFDLTAKNGKAKLSFQTHGKGDTLSVTSSASKVLGMGEDGVSSYLNTNTKLKDIFKGKFHEMTEDEFKEYAKTNPDDVKNRGLTLKDGKVVDKDGVVQMNKLSITINGETMSFGEDTTIDGLMSQINGNKDAGVNISYSKLTNQFSIKGTETGVNSKVAISGDLAGIFGFTEAGNIKYVDTSGDTNVTKEYDLNNLSDADRTFLKDKGIFAAGQDAEFNVTINGENMKMTRSSNVVDFDGMTVTLNKTFNGKVDADGNPTDDVTTDPTKWDPITFKTESDSDKIVDAIQSFVDDYNAMVTEIRNQYSTMPAEKSSSSHTRYEPLTDEDRESMSESAIQAYEEKAKQGILFGETELSSLHSALRNAITGISTDMNVSYTESADFNRMLQKIGISTKYSSGLTTLELDTEKLRKAIEEDPDTVRNAFTQTKENGASTDGLMQRVQKVVNQYANTSSGSPGILVQRAGSQYAPTSVNNNALQEQYNRYSEQIEKLQSKMADRIDYYTRQFTALEQMMVQMNSQSSALAGLMGGSGGSY